MSGRGGRGRGRGGGRGWTPPTGAQLYLKRSAEECGLDASNLRILQDITRPSLFPDIQVPVNSNSSSGVSSTLARNTKLIQKGREMHHRYQQSVFYVKILGKNVPEVLRYRDRQRPPPITDATAVLSHCLGGRTETEMGAFVPTELLSGQLRKRRKLPADGNSGGKGSSSALGEWEERENKSSSGPTTASADDANADGVLGGGEGDQEGEDAWEIEDEEEEEVADYVMDYYASDDEASNGEDGEPTF